MPRPILIGVVSVLTVIIAAAAVWTLGPNRQSPIPTTPSQPPTPANTSSMTLGELNLCKDFPKTANEISCEDALSIVKKKYPGAVQEVSSGVFQKEDTSQGIATWVIEIELDKPIVRKNNTFDTIRLFLRRDTGEEFRITRGNE